MTPTEVLSSEHRIIEQVLDCLEEMARRGKADGHIDAQDAGDALAFFREFADAFHHAKEEAHLFPAMEAKGFPRNGGPTGVMLYEHEQGRLLIGAMIDVVEEASAGEAQAIAAFASNALAYVDLLREHINKEDHCLFSMANQAFTEADQERVQELFKQTDGTPEKEGVRDRFVKLAGRLSERYLTTQPS